jgi:hypothetical protein
MKDLQRGLLVFYSLLLIGACVLCATLVWDQTRQLDIDLGAFRITAGITSGDTERLLFTLMLICIGFFAALSMAIAVIPMERYRPTLRIRQPNGADVEVAPPAMEAVLRDELERLPDVRQAYPVVRFTRDEVEAHLTVFLEPYATISHVAHAVQHTAEETLRERFHVTRLRRPGIHISYEVAEPGHDPMGRVKPQVAFDPPPAPLPVRHMMRPNDGHLEFPADDHA